MPTSSKLTDRAVGGYLDHPAFDAIVAAVAVGVLAVLDESNTLEWLGGWTALDAQRFLGALMTVGSVSFGFVTFSMGFFFNNDSTRVQLVRDGAGERVALNFRTIVRSILFGIGLLVTSWVLLGPAATTTVDDTAFYVGAAGAILVALRLTRVVVLMNFVIRLLGKPEASSAPPHEALAEPVSVGVLNEK